MPLINQLSMVRYFSPDPQRLRHFYEETLEVPVEWSDDNIAILNTGSAKIGIEKSDDEEPVTGHFLAISFDTEDIQQTVETLKSRGVTFSGEPQKQYWGGTLAHFEDPDGNTLTLVEYPKG